MAYLEPPKPPHLSIKTPEKYLLKNLPLKTQMKDARYFAWQKRQATNKRLGRHVQTWQEYKLIHNKET